MGKRIAACLMLAVGLQTQAETITATKAMPDGNIQLRWSSLSNAIYRIDYLEALASTNNTWRTLWEGIPATGTNTHFLDVGNYDGDGEIPVPRNHPHRFYRVVRTGTNEITPPIVSLVGTTNNQEFSGEFTLSFSATTTNTVVGWDLYVDGQ
jgi:hypothetical protein